MSYEMLNREVAEQIAAYLLDIEAVKINTKKPFTWSSGLKSPVYCDNRFTLSFPDIRTYIKEKLVEAIKFHFPEVEMIAGVATAGIPQGALVAEELSLPFNYVRAKAKSHGTENKVEGKVLKNKKVVLIEDLISTGGSSLAAADTLYKAGYTIIGTVAIFTYGFHEADERFEEVKLPLVCLSSYSYIIEEAIARNYVNEKQVILLKSWRVDPYNWKNK